MKTFFLFQPRRCCIKFNELEICNVIRVGAGQLLTNSKNNNISEVRKKREHASTPLINIADNM